MGEYLEEENYWGFGTSYIDGSGIRREGERPSAVLKSEEFSKSLQSGEEGENGEGYYIDEFGRKIKGHELKSLNISEISFVDKPATLKTFSVVKNLEDKKGDDKMKKSDFRWSDNCQRILRGFSDSDLLEVSEGDLEIEKSSDTNPFPSLAKVFSRNIQNIEDFIEEENLEERFV